MSAPLHDNRCPSRQCKVEDGGALCVFWLFVWLMQTRCDLCCVEECPLTERLHERAAVCSFSFSSIQKAVM